MVFGARKTKSRDLYIRKVSCSGSSVSSGSFSSTSSSCSTLRELPSPTLTTSAASLSSPSTSSLSSTRRSPPSASFFDPLSLHPTFQAPPRLQDRPMIRVPEGRGYQDVSTFEDDSEEEEEEEEEELLPREDKACLRPQLLRSRWSESTIATVQSSFGDGMTPAPVAHQDEMVSKRPSMRHMDSFDEFVKRGCWKRRGIVFHSEDMRDL